MATNSQSSQLMKRARNHLDKAERALNEASTAPAWAVELLGALRCILDASESTAPAVMQSARKAQEGDKHGKH